MTDAPQIAQKCGFQPPYMLHASYMHAPTMLQRCSADACQMLRDSFSFSRRKTNIFTTADFSTIPHPFFKFPPISHLSHRPFFGRECDEYPHLAISLRTNKKSHSTKIFRPHALYLAFPYYICPERNSRLMGKFINPFTDTGFKKIFGKEEGPVDQFLEQSARRGEAHPRHRVSRQGAPQPVPQWAEHDLRHLLPHGHG